MAIQSTKQFLEQAKALQVKVGDITIHLPAKPFSSGSVGWHAAIKLPVVVGEDAVMVQFNLMGTVVGSKKFSDANLAVEAKQAIVAAFIEKQQELKTESADRKDKKRIEREAKLKEIEATKLAKLEQETQNS